MTRNQWIGIGAFVVVAATAVFVMTRDEPEAVPIPLEIGPDTTRITEPLDANGSVDYVGALNAGPVPPADENAAIPLIRALGTFELVGDAPAVLAQLGAPDDMPRISSLIEPGEEIEFEDPVEDVEAPFSKEEAQAFERWVDINEDVLRLVVIASERPRLWLPVVRVPEAVLGHALPEHRIVTLLEVLVARADRARARGDLAGAWGDARTLLRLEALLGQLRGGIGFMIAGSIRRTAFDVIENLLVAGAPPAELTTDVLLALLDLEPLRNPAGDIDGFDRFMVLDGFLDDLPRTPGGGIHAGAHDVNVVLREINARLDETIETIPVLERENVAALETLVDDGRQRVRGVSSDLQSTIGQVRHALEPERRNRESRIIGDVLASMVMAIAPSMVNQVAHLERRRHVLILGCAARLHALQHGALPASPDALVPDILGALPEHPLVDPIPYDRSGDECQIGDNEDAIRLRR